MNYFAYGSNMSTAYLRRYCPSATFLLRAALPNFRIEFRRYSTDLQGGISTILEAPGELVQGVVYEIPEAEILALDELEDVPLGLYRRDSFLVLGEDGAWHAAALYRVVTPTGPYAPAASYVEMMVTGAMEHGLPADYVARLVALRQGAAG